MTFRVEPIGALDTHDLRRRVLRANDPDVSVAWPEDEDEGTVHLGVIDAHGAIVGTSTWMDDGRGGGVRLRGMAIDPALHGSGVGATLLTAGIERFRAEGHERIWANARMSAIGFYERAGFVSSGPVFVTEETGLAHRVVELTLGGVANGV